MVLVVSTVPAYQHIADDLRARVLSGALVPGERLPVEAELCIAYGVSRSTVREALRALASQQLVTTVRGVQGGTFIAHPEAGLVSASLETSLGLLAGAEEVDVAELLEARELLEVPAARLAAERRTEAHLELMRGSRQEHGFEGNRSFHELIVEASGNRLLAMVTRPVFGVLRERFLRDQAPKSFWRTVDRDHDAIFEAIEGGDADSAGDLMRAHLARLATTYTRIDRRASR